MVAAEFSQIRVSCESARDLVVRTLFSMRRSFERHYAEEVVDQQLEIRQKRLLWQAKPPGYSQALISSGPLHRRRPESPGASACRRLPRCPGTSVSGGSSRCVVPGGGGLVGSHHHPPRRASLGYLCAYTVQGGHRTLLFVCSPLFYQNFRPINSCRFRPTTPAMLCHPIRILAMPLIWSRSSPSLCRSTSTT